jgi:hypothetical protein
MMIGQRSERLRVTTSGMRVHVRQHASVPSFVFCKRHCAVMLLVSWVNKNNQHLQLLIIVVVATDGKLPVFCPLIKRRSVEAFLH